MKRRDFLASSILGTLGVAASRFPLSAGAPAPTRKILIAGGGFGTAFIRYMAELTGKKRPKLLYLPTASADGPAGIISWFRACAPLDVYPLAQESFIASTRQTESWENVLLGVDGIVASGGNTLNQQAIWKAQGIDVILKQAWDRGIVLGGASAGSLCWFLKGSHCPHYDREKDRRPLYQKLIGSGEMQPGYACDNDAGLYFEDNDVKRVVSTRADAKCYYVSVAGGKVGEKVLEPERIT